MKQKHSIGLGLAISVVLALPPSIVRAAAEPLPEAQGALGRELLQELIETDTTPDHGSTTAAAESLARRF